MVKWRTRGYFEPGPKYNEVTWHGPGPYHTPGRLVPLNPLNPQTKQQLWNGINRVDPKRADSMSSLQSDPEYQALADTFGPLGLLMPENEFKRFMHAGKGIKQ
jgi:hypothetical protein